MKYPFNVRAYGALIVNGQVLLINESFKGVNMTKLPGGGLEFGEGLKQCVIREFQEELGMEIKIDQHIYTTDFFQPSAFNPKEQLISVYYKVSAVDNNFNFENIEPLEPSKKLYWHPLNTMQPDVFTFPVDKYVSEMLVNLS